ADVGVPAHQRRLGRRDDDPPRYARRVARDDVSASGDETTPRASQTGTPRFALAAIDIDDTLVGHDGAISAANAAAVARLVEMGTRGILASGRRHGDMQTRWTEYDQSRNAEPHRVVDDVLTSGEAGAVPDDVVKVIWLGDADAINAATAPAHARYDARLVVTRTDPPYLEFSAPNVTKATALAAVARTLGVAQAEVLAFGDGNNDAAMLAWAGLGVAMPHASPAAQAAADRIGPEGDPE